MAKYWKMMVDGVRLRITVGIVMTSPDFNFKVFSPYGWSLIICPDVMKSTKWFSWSAEYFSLVDFLNRTGSPTPIWWMCSWAFLNLYLVNPGMSYNTMYHVYNINISLHRTSKGELGFSTKICNLHVNYFSSFLLLENPCLSQLWTESDAEMTMYVHSCKALTRFSNVAFSISDFDVPEALSKTYDLKIFFSRTYSWKHQFKTCLRFIDITLLGSYTWIL